MPTTLAEWISVAQGVAFIAAVMAVYFKHKAMTDANTAAIGELRRDFEQHIELERERRREDQKNIEKCMQNIDRQLGRLNGDISVVKEANFTQQLDTIQKGVDEIRQIVMACPWRTRRPGEFIVKDK